MKEEIRPASFLRCALHVEDLDLLGQCIWCRMEASEDEEAQNWGIKRRRLRVFDINRATECAAVVVEASDG